MYEIEIRNDELHKFRVIRGKDRYVVEQKARAQVNQLLSVWWTRPLDNERSNTATATDNRTQRRLFLERIQRALAAQGRAHRAASFLGRGAGDCLRISSDAKRHAGLPVVARLDPGTDLCAHRWQRNPPQPSSQVTLIASDVVGGPPEHIYNFHMAPRGVRPASGGTSSPPNPPRRKRC